MCLRLIIISVVLCGGAFFVQARLGHNEFPDRYMPNITIIRNRCFEKMGLTWDDHDKMEFTDNLQQTRCYMSCICIEAGWMNDDGLVQFEYINHFIESQKSTEAKDHLDTHNSNCPEHPDGADICEKGFNFVVCIKHNIGDDKFLFP